MRAQVSDYDGQVLGNYDLVNPKQDVWYWQSPLSKGILSLGGVYLIPHKTRQDAIEAIKRFYGGRVTLVAD